MTLRDVLSYDRIKEAVAQYIKRRLEGERGRRFTLKPRDIERIRGMLGIQSPTYNDSIRMAVEELLDGCIVDTLVRVYRHGHGRARRTWTLIDVRCAKEKL